MKDPKNKIGMQRLGVILLSGLILLEFGLRLVTYTVLKRPFWDDRKYVPDEYAIWKLNPGYEGRWEDIPYLKINSLGLVGPELKSPKGDSTVRVAVIGSSVTFGKFCPSLDSSCCHLLLDLLNQREDGKRYELLNGSVYGYSSYNGMQFVLHQLDRLEADILIISFGWNDGAFDVAADKIPGKDWKIYDTSTRGALTYSYILQWIAALSERLCQKLQKEQPLVRSGDFPCRVSPEDFKANITAMVEKCAQLDVKPVLLCEPHPHGVPDIRGKLTIHERYQKSMRQLSSEQGIPLTDADSVFALYPAEEFFDDPAEPFVYPNTKGQHLMAQVMYETLESESYLK